MSSRAAWLPRWLKAAGIGSLACVACASGASARFPKRPVGCEVKLFHEIPDVPTENIGPVHARCAEDIPKDDCLRTLMDAVCDLGGDVLWGVDEPRRSDGETRYAGRAAHTKIPKSGAP